MRCLKDTETAPGISDSPCSAEAGDTSTDDHHINICHGISLSPQLVADRSLP
jgi:hypothetical protein